MARNETEQVRHLQRTLYSTAKQSQAVKFYSLYDKVWRNDVLREAWRQVKADRGAPGVDNETIEGIESRGEEEGMLSRLQEQLRAKSHRFQPVRRVDIPKTEGRHSATGDRDGSRSRGANCDEAGAGTDLRGRLSPMFLRLPSAEDG